MTTNAKENHAFIDGQNLHSGVRALGWKMDHKKFREYLRDEFNVTKAYMFVGYMEEHQDLYNALQEAGFICFFKPLLRYEDGSIKGNVDADMVLQVMIDIENFDKAVLVTGDGDFAGLIRHLASERKLGQVIIPNSRNYSSLFERMDEFGKDKHFFTFVDNLRSKLSYHPGGRSNNHRSNNRRPAARSSEPKVSDKTTKPAAAAAAKPVAKKAATSKDSTVTKSIKKPVAAKRTTTAKPKAATAKPAAERATKKPAPRKRMTYKEKLESSLIDTINNAADI